MKVDDRETPDQLFRKTKSEQKSKIVRYLPVNQNFTTIIHGFRDPLNDVLKVRANILVWWILDIQYFVLEVLGKEWIHAAHSLDDMCNTRIFEVMKWLCSLHTTDVKLRDNLRHVWHVWLIY